MWPQWVEDCRTHDDEACERLAWLAVSQPPPPIPSPRSEPTAPAAGRDYGPDPTYPDRFALRDWAAAQSCRRGDRVACEVVGPDIASGLVEVLLPEPLPDLDPAGATPAWSGTWVGQDQVFQLGPRRVVIDGVPWKVERSGFGVLWAHRRHAVWRLDRIEADKLRAEGPGYPIPFALWPTPAE